MNLTRVKTEEIQPSYRLIGEKGTLTYDPVWSELSADGDLPYWMVAKGHADYCRRALSHGEDALWRFMENHYREAVAR